jgi:choline dehydrogenase-like flavoprotein
MTRVVVIGSGASGVHFALSVLQKGYDVVMLDVGRVRPPIVNPSDSFADLKRTLEDPVGYFLGPDYEAVVYPGSAGEYYGFPPNKTYVFSTPRAFVTRPAGFEPLSSFAQGGLAEAWTGGAYPLNDTDLAPFPFGYRDLEPSYGEVARRIGINGEPDDLARFYPVHDGMMPPLRLDRHSTLLLERYERSRAHLNETLGCYVGRSRVATLSATAPGRAGCGYLGRCLWGCPVGALYTPVMTLDACRRFTNFTYVSDVYVRHFRVGSGRRISAAVIESADGRALDEVTGDRFVLAAGTLSSSAIYMRTVRQETGETITLRGLMDNRQVLVPFLNLALVGRAYDPNSYQYHQIAMGIDRPDLPGYVHAQITTLKTALVHPIVQNMPIDLRSALSLFRALRAGLGVVNVNLPDTRRDGNYVTLGDDRDGVPPLVIHYAPDSAEPGVMRRAVGIINKALRRLGCVIPPGMSHIRPMGASVHYAGTVPMSAPGGSHTASSEGVSSEYGNLTFVDGTTFPALPAKNLTLTLMANAVRIATASF